MRVHLVEITGYDPATEGERVLRFARGSGFVTAPDDDPPNTYYMPRVRQPARLGRQMFGRGTTSGEIELELGQVVLDNQDGALDYMLELAFDGRPLRVLTGEEGTSYGDLSEALVATIEGVAVRRERVIVHIRDRQAALAVPIQPVKYAGDNVLPDGVEGVESDLKDKPKPLVFGRVLNVRPACVNTARLIYQVSANALSDLPAVYDRASPLTRAADYASFEDLMNDALEPLPGTYRAWLAGGMFRLGSTPVGIVTCNATEGATLEDRTVAQVWQRIMEHAGYTDADYSAADVAALDDVAPYECGIFIDSETTVAAALNRVTAGVAWWGADRLGLFRIAQFPDPAEMESLREVVANHMLRPLDQPAPKDGLPAHKVIVRYQQNYTIQDAYVLDGAPGADAPPPVFSGPWEDDPEAEEPYDEGDIVQHDGGSYVAEEETAGVPPGTVASPSPWPGKSWEGEGDAHSHVTVGGKIRFTNALRTGHYVYDRFGVRHRTTILEHVGYNFFRFSAGHPSFCRSHGPGVQAADRTVFAPFELEGGLYFDGTTDDHAYPLIVGDPEWFEYSTMAVSFFVVMDDGTAPVVGTDDSTGDFCIIVSGEIADSDVRVSKIHGSLYRVSAVGPAKLANEAGALNYGVRVYPAQASRGFACTGFVVDYDYGTGTGTYLRTYDAQPWLPERMVDALRIADTPPFEPESEWWIYTRVIHTAHWGGGLITFGPDSGPGAELELEVGWQGEDYLVRWRNGKPSDGTSTIELAPGSPIQFGDVVELLVEKLADGKLRGILSVNGDTPVVDVLSEVWAADPGTPWKPGIVAGDSGAMQQIYDFEGGDVLFYGTGALDSDPAVALQHARDNAVSTWTPWKLVAAPGEQGQQGPPGPSLWHSSDGTRYAWAIGSQRIGYQSNGTEDTLRLSYDVTVTLYEEGTAKISLYDKFRGWQEIATVPLTHYNDGTWEMWGGSLTGTIDTELFKDSGSGSDSTVALNLELFDENDDPIEGAFFGSWVETGVSVVP